jgi:hypothetical protein
MSRNIASFLSILGILVLLSLAGCQKYKAPEYQSPDGSTEIDISDIEETQDEGVDFEETEENTEDIEEDVEEDTDETTPRQTTTYRPATTNDADYKKSPYRPVVEEDLPTVSAIEGELVKIGVKAKDADGDDLRYSFTAPLNNDGKWQTRGGDAGVYYSDITVSDGKGEVKKRIKILVEPKNNKPSLKFIPNVIVDEGQVVRLAPVGTDADGDKLTYEYSGWMSSATKTAGYSDAGVHKVTVMVSDGISTVSQEVTITVNDVNRLPDVELEY